MIVVVVDDGGDGAVATVCAFTGDVVDVAVIVIVGAAQFMVIVLSVDRN